MTIFTAAPDRQNTDSTKWLKFGNDVIPAWVADMDCVAAPAIVAAMQARVAHGIFGYAEPTSALLNTVCEYFERRWQWQISPQWVVYLPGLGTAIHNVCRMAAEDGGGGEVITPTPIYHTFLHAPQIANAKRIDAPMQFQDGEWQLPVATLESLRTPQTRVVQLCNPHNPNGKVYSRDELLEVGEFCCRHNLILCADEVHADIILDQNKTHLCIAALDEDIARHTITLQSPSKAFNIAGLNFAVAIIPDETLRRRFCASLVGKSISHLNAFGMVAAQAAWGGECDTWLVEATAQLRKNRDALSDAVAAMPRLHMPHLASTYLAWLQMDESLSAEDFLRVGLGLSTGESFGDANYMRLNFGCSPPLLQEIIRRLQQL